MLPESWWIWLMAAAGGWVFLGLVAGRFHNARRELDKPRRLRPPTPSRQLSDPELQ
jgi:hypothetical protein